MTGPILAFLLVFVGLLGLVIGSFLNVVIYRVPAGIPLVRESRCPHCDAPVRPWQNIPVLSWLLLRGTCANCRAPISARYPLLELATGIAFVAVVSWTVSIDGPSTGSGAVWGADAAWALVPTAMAYLYLASISIALAMTDLDTHRLPNAIVLPGYAVLAVLFTAACVLGAPWEALVRAFIGAAALFAFYFALRLVRPGGMGGGDVKLAGVLGATLGFVGWGPLVLGAFAAFLLGGVFGVALMLSRRAGRKSAIPFGPWMIAGAWIGLFTGETVGRWYLGLLEVG